MKSPQTTARLAGILYIIITVAAIIAHFVVPDQLIIAGDAAATAENIATSESMFRFGMIGGELVILISEVILSIVLYVLLRPVNKTLSLIAAVSRLVMTAIHGLNLLNYYVILQVLNGADIASTFSPDQVNALVALFLDMHSYGFSIGIAFLVPHVLVLGYLIFTSGYFPRVLGILFMFAGVGYLIDVTGHLLISDYTTTPGAIAAVIAIAEIAFPVWLLVKGVKIADWQQRNLVPEAA